MSQTFILCFVFASIVLSFGARAALSDEDLQAQSCAVMKVASQQAQDPDVVAWLKSQEPEQKAFLQKIYGKLNHGIPYLPPEDRKVGDRSWKTEGWWKFDENVRHEFLEDPVTGTWGSSPKSLAKQFVTSPKVPPKKSGGVLETLYKTHAIRDSDFSRTLIHAVNPKTKADELIIKTKSLKTPAEITTRLNLRTGAIVTALGSQLKCASDGGDRLNHIGAARSHRSKVPHRKRKGYVPKSEFYPGTVYPEE